MRETQMVLMTRCRTMEAHACNTCHTQLLLWLLEQQEPTVQGQLHAEDHCTGVAAAGVLTMVL
jgi:hypothetical protein